MPGLYKGYCYSTLSEIGNLMVSESPVSYGDGISQVYSYTIQGSSLMLTYRYAPFTLSNNGPTYFLGFLKSIPICSEIGPVSSVSGLSLVDVEVVSWLVVLVLVTAFSFKSMARVR